MGRKSKRFILFERDDPFLEVENMLSLLFPITTAEITPSYFEVADVNSRDNEGCTPLHLAAKLKRNSLEETRRLLLRFVDIEAKNKKGYTPVICASQSLNWDTCEFLLLTGAKVQKNISKDKDIQCVLDRAYKNKSIQNKHYKTIQFEMNWPIFDIYNEKYNVMWQNTILHVAIHCSSVDSVGKLIKKGADINACNSRKDTPLHFAATYSSGPELVALLIRNKVNVNATDYEGKSPLHKAVEKKSREAVRVLLQNGSDVNAQDKRGMSALHYAAELDTDEITEELLRHKDINTSVTNQRKQTSLHCATSKIQAHNVKCLLHHGVELDVADGDGNTAVLIAAAKGSLEILRLLVEKGANINATDERGQTALFRSIINKDLETVKYLLRNNATAHNMDAKGHLPSFYAVRDTSKEIMQLLVDERTVTYKSLLEIADRNNIVNTVRWLKGKGNVNVDEDGSTELHHAACKKRKYAAVKLMECLCKSPDSYFVQDNMGNTPLHIACARGKFSIVKFLVVNGDRRCLEIRNNEGQTPLNIAEKKKRHSILKFITDLEANDST